MGIDTKKIRCQLAALMLTANPERHAEAMRGMPSWEDVLGEIDALRARVATLEAVIEAVVRRFGPMTVMLPEGSALEKEPT